MDYRSEITKILKESGLSHEYRASTDNFSPQLIIDSLISRLLDGASIIRHSMDKLYTSYDDYNSLAAQALSFVSEYKIVHYKNILITNLVDAMYSVKMYNIPEYITKATQVFSKDGIITINDDTNGKYSVSINAEEVAGTWQDLEIAIDAGRATYPEAKNKLVGRLATIIWALKLYEPAVNGKPLYAIARNKDGSKYVSNKEVSPARYARLKEIYEGFMFGALSGVMDKFPFWLLLEYGNTNCSLSTDKGGKPPHPIIKPSHFLARSKAEINSLIEQDIEAEISYSRASILDEIRMLGSRYDSHYMAIDALRDLKKGFVESTSIDDVFGAQSKLAMKLNDLAYVELSKILKSHQVDDKKRKIARLRLEKAMLDIISGSLPEGKRVYLGISGTTQLRKRTTRLSQTIKYEYERLKDGDISQERLDSIYDKIAGEIARLRSLR